jgi:hypothetical protein
LLLRVDYKRLALVGTVLLVVGTFLMSRTGPSSERFLVMANLALIGAGMGMGVPAFLIAVQSTVERSSLGTATSMLQFSRSIGGTIGVGVMGALLSSTVMRSVQAAGGAIDSSTISSLLAGGEAGGATVAIDESLRVALAAGTTAVFTTALVAAVLALVVVAFAPGGQISAMAANREQELAPGAAGAAPLPAAALPASTPAGASQLAETPVNIMEL